MKNRPEGLKSMTLEYHRVKFIFFPFFKTVCLVDAFTGESSTISWDQLESIISERKLNNQGAGI